jgi:hypothetical protein
MQGEAAMQRNFALAIVAAAIVVSGPASAGSAPYQNRHQPGDAALAACLTRVNAASTALTGMHVSAQQDRAIDDELAIALNAHQRGNVQECVAHVAKAEAMEH